MSSDRELTTAKYLAELAEPETPVEPFRAAAETSTSTRFFCNALRFAAIVLFSAFVITGGMYIYNNYDEITKREAKQKKKSFNIPTHPMDIVLWMGGHDMSEGGIYEQIVDQQRKNFDEITAELERPPKFHRRRTRIPTRGLRK
jgi:hypothetical protein